MARILRVWWGLIALCVWGCTPYAVTVAVVPTSACGAWAVSDAQVTCHILNDNEYVFVAPQQVTVTYQRLRVTVEGTVIVTIQGDTVYLVVLDGVSIINVATTSRIIPEGARVAINLIETSLTVSDAVPYDQRDLSDGVLQILPSDFVYPTPIAPPVAYTVAPLDTRTPTPLSLTDLAIGTATPEPTVCAPREDWLGRYPVQRGDLLSNIAAEFGITLDELQAGNCIVNANRIAVGLVLRVPYTVATDTVASDATLTPSAVAFRVDKDTLSNGECTVLRWDVFNVSAVYLDEALTSANNLAQVCPVQTTTYWLRVIYPDGSQTTHSVTITLVP